MNVIVLDKQISNKIPHTISLNNKSKIMVVGTSGSGKSTLARKISHKLNLKDIELDALFWKSNWQQTEPEIFKSKIETEITGIEGFIIHGNYNEVRDVTFGSCDTVIWLDYSKVIVMWRVIKRTIIRVLTKKTLWEGNTETLKKAFLSKESIILWAWNTYELRRRQYLQIIHSNIYNINTFVVIKKPGSAKFLLNFINK